MSPDWSEIVVSIETELATHPKDYLRARWISKTMHPEMRPLSEKYWKELVRDDYFVRDILPAAIDSPAGKPHEFEWFPRISPQSIQHAYYLAMMAKHGFPVTEARSIVEIGAGYGNFARIVRNMGSRARYLIIDLPQIHRLQQMFLAEARPDHGIQFEDLQAVTPADLLVGTFSISEMPMEQRDYLERRYADYQHVFIGTTESFCGFQNVPYFEALAKRIGAKFVKDKHRNAWFVVR